VVICIDLSKGRDMLYETEQYITKVKEIIRGEERVDG
jgi:hypothetical protein